VHRRGREAMISVTQKASDEFKEIMKSVDGSGGKMMRINFVTFG
jgi:predicted lactoylglutathione lyase